MESDNGYKQRIGRNGEDIACRFLEGNGHVILERNFRSGHLEIDIISLDCHGIHFVEVKTRKLSVQAPPQDSVNRQKQRRIVAAAKRFLNSNQQISPEECFFDVIAITYKEDAVHTEWIPQAFTPIYL